MWILCDVADTFSWFLSSMLRSLDVLDARFLLLDAFCISERTV